MSTNRAAVYAELLRELSRMNTRSVLLTQAVADRLRMNPTDLECYGLVSDQGQLTAGQLAE
ncbi:MAG: MarR family transcriptional regulator, partial [Chloroflexi bacterium]|nr:MarR family transcriptional regulator [Chloroflexota bacterium]